MLSQTLIERYRQEIVTDALNSSKFKAKVWEPHWKPWITEYLDADRNFEKMKNLGEKFSDLYRSTKSIIDTGYSDDPVKNRNSLVSIGGSAWQCLNVWYLNLLALGSGYVVMHRKKTITPEPILLGTNAYFANEKIGKEPDLYIIGIPKESEFFKDFNVLLKKYKSKITARKIGDQIKQLVNIIAIEEYKGYEVGVLQLKTNWNDLVQSVVLWNVLYSKRGELSDLIEIGENYKVEKITYAFITAPSNVTNTNFESHSTQVKRVKTFNGGNYWGLPEKKDVAKAIWQLYSIKFKEHFSISNSADYSKYLKDYGFPSYFELN